VLRISLLPTGTSQIMFPGVVATHLSKIAQVLPSFVAQHQWRACMARQSSNPMHTRTSCFARLPAPLLTHARVPAHPASCRHACSHLPTAPPPPTRSGSATSVRLLFPTKIHSQIVSSGTCRRSTSSQ
jgi:hypothetical protein